MSELPILKLLAPLLFGIYLSDLFFGLQDFGWSNNWLVFGVTLILIVFVFINKSYRYRKLNFLFVIVSMFLLGFSLQQFSNDLKAKNHYTKSGVNSEYLTGEILELQDSPGRYSKCILSVDEVLSDSLWTRSSGKILIYLNSGEQNLMVGHKILINTNLSLIQNYGNPGEFDSQSYWYHKGIYHMGFLNESSFEILNSKEVKLGLLDKVRLYSQNVLRKVLPDPYFGVANALVMGDKGDLDRSIKNEFSNAGAIHVLAVSGLHVGILLWLLNAFFKRITLFQKKNLSVILPVIILWVYAALTGFSPSVLRAVVMFTILTIGLLKGRQLFSLNVLFVSAFILLIYNPNYLFDIGFQLSYIAMIGIGVAYKPISNILYFRNKIVRKIWQGLSISLAAQLFTFPLTLYYFHQFPNYFLLTNLGMIVLAGLCLGSGVIYLFIAKIPGLNWLGAQVILISFTTMVLFVTWVSELPYAVATGFQLNLLEVFLLFFGLFLIFNGRVLMQVVKFRLGVLLCIGVLVFIQFNRFENMSLVENRVLNTNFPVVISKSGLTSYAYFSPSTESDKKQLDFMLQSYSKFYGTQVQAIDLSESKVYFDKNEDLIVKSSDEYLEISNRDNLLQVRTSNEFNLVLNVFNKGQFTNVTSKNRSIVVDSLFL